MTSQETPNIVARPLAVVTGASSGIGYELARRFAINGFDLVVAADEAEIIDAARELESAGATVTAQQVDLATAEGVEQLYDAVRSVGRPVTAAALNAGVGVNGRFDEID